MAQAKKRRSRKHRGTQAGTIERSGRTGRPQTRTEARDIARKRRAERFERPPTWRGSLNRAVIAAGIFALAAVLLLGQSPLQGLTLGAVMVLLYLPMTYYTDLFIYNRRRRRKAKSGRSGSDGSPPSGSGDGSRGGGSATADGARPSHGDG